MTKRGHKISEVKPDSIASELELKPGDVLLAINGQEIEDVFPPVIPFPDEASKDSHDEIPFI